MAKKADMQTPKAKPSVLLTRQNLDLKKPPEKSKQEEPDQQDILVRGIAHDINNNLMAIMGACDQMETSSKLQGELPKILNLIRNQINHASSHLRDLVNNYHSDKPVVMTREELQNFLRNSLSSLALLAGDNSRVELGSVKTPPVLVNRKPLLRVLFQLTRNIAELEIDHPLAYLSVRQVNEWCELSIADNGPGIVGVNADDIFKPGVSSRGGRGTRGYGLATVARTVEEWGGEYGVEHIAGDSGCRFWVRLPLALDE